MATIPNVSKFVVNLPEVRRGPNGADVVWLYTNIEDANRKANDFRSRGIKAEVSFESIS